jgi:hypothetical protein
MPLSRRQPEGRVEIIGSLIGRKIGPVECTGKTRITRRSASGRIGRSNRSGGAVFGGIAGGSARAGNKCRAAKKNDGDAEKKVFSAKKGNKFYLFHDFHFTDQRSSFGKSLFKLIDERIRKIAGSWTMQIEVRGWAMQIAVHGWTIQNEVQGWPGLSILRDLGQVEFAVGDLQGLRGVRRSLSVMGILPSAREGAGDMR